MPQCTMPECQTTAGCRCHLATFNVAFGVPRRPEMYCVPADMAVIREDGSYFIVKAGTLITIPD